MKLTSLKISHRITLAVFLAVLGILLIAVPITSEKISTLKKVQQIKNLTNLGVNIGALIHELQKERGASAVHLGSNGKLFSKELKEQLKISNKPYKILSIQFEKIKGLQYSKKTFEQKISIAKNYLSKLDRHRKEVQNMSTTVKKSFSYYSNMNKALIQVISELALLESDIKIANAIISYVAFMEAKEDTGKERAIGAGAVSEGKISIETYNKIIRLQGKEISYFNTFLSYATPAQKIFYEHVMNSEETKELNIHRQTIKKTGLNGNFGDLLTGPQFFKASTEHINLLRDVEIQLSKDLKLISSKISQDAQKDLSTIIFVILFFSLVSGLFIQIVRGFTKPLLTLAKSVETLAQGDTDLVIPAQDRDDEVGSMAKSIEIFKDNLIEKKQFMNKLENNKRALEQSEERFSLAARGASVGIWDWDVITNNEFWSDRFYKLLDYEPNEIKSSLENFEKILHPEDKERTFALIQDHFKHQVAFDIEYRLKTKNGMYRWFKGTGQAKWNKKNEPIRMVGSIEDIQNRKESEKKLLEAKELAESASRAKSSFLANMSHELRTPMNAVLGYAQLLEALVKQNHHKQYLDDLKKIRSSGSHLLSLINNVLDLSKIEAGKMEMSISSFNLNEEIKKLNDGTKTLAKKNKNQLIVDYSENLGNMKSDSTKIRQILFNLLGNACKFTKNGKVKLTVEEHMRNKEKWISFTVEDSGIGMSEEQIAKAFRPFTQADESTTRSYGGTGLGLAISKQYVDMMGGHFQVESNEGNGSKFVVWLPKIFQATSQEQLLDIHNNTEFSKIKKSKKTVLVIDDDPAMHDLTQRTLHKEEFQIISAYDGKNGLALARMHRPHMICLDIVMPEMSGWEVLDILKTEEELKDIPVILASISGEKNKGIHLGATDFLKKPIQVDELVNMLVKYRCEHPPCPVLVIEDNDQNREIFVRILSENGWAVEEAINGKEALEKVSKKIPELILLDLMMPKMDGFEFLVELRKNELWKNIPVIVATAKNLSKSDIEFLNSSAQKILKKGIHSNQELIDEILKVAKINPKYISKKEEKKSA